MSAHRAYTILFLLALVIHLGFMAVGWTRPVLDRHPFRQAQTALGARTILEGSSLFAHELPVFGKPWPVPLEFPLYQAVVAAVARVTPLAIDQAGRLVSVVAFYLLLPILYVGLQIIEPDRAKRLLMLAFVLVSPLYLFWSRTVLIESTALLFATAFAVFSIRAFDRRTWAIAAIAAGILAALVKATTLVVALVPVMVYAIFKRRPLAIVLIAIPIAAGQLWSRYANGIRVRNPLAEELTSLEHLQPWIYGTIRQRFSIVEWHGMFVRSLPTVAGETLLLDWLPLAFVLAAVGLTWSTRYRIPALVMLAAFFAGPLVFLNLYFVHDYYFYANGIYGVLFCALGVLALAEKIRRPILLPALVMTMMLITYLQDYYYSQSIGVDVPPATAAVRRLTRPEDVIVIYGEGWSPAFPYYAERRALMDPDDRPPGDPRLMQAIRNLKGDRIGAVVVSGDARKPTETLAPRLALFGCTAPPVYRDAMTDVYVPGGR